MADKSLILYDLKNKTRKEKTDITRKLFGFQDKSNNSDYTYERKGLLKDFKYKKETKVTILINSNDELKIKRILRQMGIKCRIIKIK